MALPEVCLFLIVLLLHVFFHLTVEVLDLLCLLLCFGLGGLFHGLEFSCVRRLFLSELGLELLDFEAERVTFLGKGVDCGLVGLGLGGKLGLELVFFGLDLLFLGTQ